MQDVWTCKHDVQMSNVFFNNFVNNANLERYMIADS